MIKKVVVFAHFDKNNIIQDYVIYYLKELKNIADAIIFVSDCHLAENEILKVQPFVDKVLAKHHGEYDFGSYKRGYEYLNSMNLIANIDQLIFVNDSCLGPLCNIKEIWKIMEERECDVWGFSQNRTIFKHIQSFFLVFHKNVFTSPMFKKFIFDIKKQNTKDDIILKYEIGLSKLLVENGYKLSSYLEFPIGQDITPEYIYSTKLPPLIKTSAIRNTNKIIIKLLLRYFNHKFKCKYPFELIDEYNKQNTCIKSTKSALKFLRRIFIRLHIKERRLCFLGKWHNW